MASLSVSLSVRARTNTHTHTHTQDITVVGHLLGIDTKVGDIWGMRVVEFQTSISYSVMLLDVALYLD